jgi:ABC-type glycerol-3-phosphate transport system substrate-binding protein
MDMKIRILALALGLLTLSACAGGASPSAGGNLPSEGPTGGGAEPSPSPAVNLDGYVFHIVDFSDNRFFASADQLGTPYGDAKMEAVEFVEDTYNCTIEVTNIGPGELFNLIQPAVVSGNKFADMVVTTQWAYGYLIGGGLMTDLSAIPTLDLSNPWWIPAVTEATTIGGRVLGTAGIFSHEDKSWVMFFNKRLWADHQLPDPYDLVRRGEWTFGKMREFGDIVKQDLDGSGSIDSPDDRWGLVTPRGDFFERAMYLSMGGRFFGSDPVTGMLTLECATPQAYEIIDIMSEFAQAHGMVYNGSNDHIDQLMPMFMDGKALFLAYMVEGAGNLREMTDDWGLLPTPKRGTGQADYINVVDHNAPMMGITIANKEREQAGVVMDALGAAFRNVNRIKREELEDLILRGEEDAEMMDHVENRGGYDLAVFMQYAFHLFKTPMNMVANVTFTGDSFDFAADIEGAKDMLLYQCNLFLGFEEEE